MDALTECYFLVLVRVNGLQEGLDPLGLEVGGVRLGVVLVEAYVVHQFSELGLVEHAIAVGVHALELSSEVGEELFVLSELEVKDALEEDVELELRVGVFSLPLVKLGSREWPLPIPACWRQIIT